MLRFLLLICISIFSFNAVHAISFDEKLLKSALPGVIIDSVNKTPINNILEVNTNNGILYVSNDGEYVLAGELIDLKLPQHKWNLTENTRKVSRQDLLKNISTKNLVIYPAKGKTKAQVLVFTDISCHFCQKLHEEVAKINENGIEVRYVAFPRAGANSEVGTKMAKIWCSKDKKASFDSVVKGGDLDTEVCANNPVPEQFELGQKLGVSGTPTIFLADGSKIGGYLSAADLQKIVTDAK